VKSDLFLEAFAFARKTARVKASRFAEFFTARGHEVEDLEQEALLHLWQSLSSFDLSRGSVRTFAEHVVARHVTSSVRACRSRRRDPVPIRARTTPLWPEQADLGIDVRKRLLILDPEDRMIAKLLMDSSPTEIGKLLGVSRGTVYRSVDRIRNVLKDFATGRGRSRGNLRI
jgi:RNA polymerase sigma factor (sigma-70 family)